MDALQDNGSIGEIVDGIPVGVALVNGQVAAFRDICPHAGARLSGGKIRRGRIFCPVHGAPFSLDDGACLSPQRYPSLQILAARVIDGWIEVALSGNAEVPDVG